ncbi:unnamed protein product [Triticum turgidum subsp. durum]|uniref:Uncharacterized protein n=1 Tax=Triticum turgidum subsp. durum TaxID=4567 RepID=A0A9R1RCN2_TRITD|nr:unnamed protein product [Triticum turgidum subsp. durum]
MEEGGDGSLEARPGVLLVGAPGVGKRTILSRLIGTEVPDTSDLSSALLNLVTTGVQLFDPQFCSRLIVSAIMQESSLLTLRNWVGNIDVQRFEVLLCIGNKADLVPGHGAHVEYRRHMQKIGESSSDPHPEYLDFGINENEGCGLLSEEEPQIEIRDSTLQWCIEQNIEYIEACASNADFDKCLSVDGDSQGLERLFGALSAHMWPGMILKSGNKITTPSLVEKDESTDDELTYEFDYEVLSHASDEQWEFIGESSTSRSLEGLDEAKSMQDNTQQVVNGNASSSAPNPLPNDRSTEPAEENPVTQSHATEDSSNHVDNTGADTSEDQRTDTPEVNALFEDDHYGVDDLERLMSEIGNMRSNLRLVPDFQRREMAAKIAMKMATMFGDSDDEGFHAV